MAFYAVKKGRKTGIYSTWKECEKNTKGYKGQQFKKFERKESAQAYMQGRSNALIDRLEQGMTLEEATSDMRDTKKQGEAIKKARVVKSKRAKEDICHPNVWTQRKILDDARQIKSGEAIVYVDGSFVEGIRKVGAGAVIILPDGTEHEVSLFSEDREFVEMQNVGGELMATMHGIYEASKHGVHRVYVHHDLANIAEWGTLSWKRNLNATNQYASYIQSCAENMEIIFVKVPAHTGLKYNEKADRLASVYNFVEERGRYGQAK